ncbi:MAG: cell division protein FtsL [Kangiellaceae bacterium]|mgnify:CR=1 FL=1|jgi:cell division protein FtsL|nr:cell division protein FtsL [Kangiellaceae bacterium]|tara:strand:+ start:5373 stop:5699 length:327 start_codon:yes stop_codon:yes gene_type:complete
MNVMMKVKQQAELSHLIARDWWQGGLLALLIFAVFASAFGVVYSSHVKRHLSAEYESLLQQQDKLDNQWRNAKLEISALASHARIERIAKAQLDMSQVEPDYQVVVVQ